MRIALARELAPARARSCTTGRWWPRRRRATVSTGTRLTGRIGAASSIRSWSKGNGRRRGRRRPGRRARAAAITRAKNLAAARGQAEKFMLWLRSRPPRPRRQGSHCMQGRWPAPSSPLWNKIAAPACYADADRRRSRVHGSTHHRSLRQFHPWRDQPPRNSSTGWPSIAGSSAAALALLPLLQNDYARAAIVAPDDARLAIDKVAYDARRHPHQRLSGAAEGEGQTPGGHRHPREPRAQSAHQGRGAPARARRLPGLAVDMLSPLGGTPADEDKARDMIGTLNADETAHRIAAAVPFLEHHAESTGKVGAVGFCWGGGMVNRAGGAVARSEGGGRLLRRAAAGRAGAVDPGGAAAALCRARPARRMPASRPTRRR